MEGIDLLKLTKSFKEGVKKKITPPITPPKTPEEKGEEFKAKMAKKYEKIKESKSAKETPTIKIKEKYPKKIIPTTSIGIKSAKEEDEIMREFFNKINKRLEKSDSISTEVLNKIKDNTKEKLKDKFVDDKNGHRQLIINFILLKLSKKDIKAFAESIVDNKDEDISSLFIKYIYKLKNRRIGLDFSVYMRENQLEKEEKKLEQMLELNEEKNELAEDILFRKTIKEAFNNYEKNGSIDDILEILVEFGNTNDKKEFIDILKNVLGEKSLIQFMKTIIVQPLDYSNKFGDTVEIMFLNFVNLRPKLLSKLESIKGDYQFKRKLNGKPIDFKTYKYVKDGEEFEFTVPLKRETKILLTSEDGESVAVDRDKLVNIVKKVELVDKYSLQDYILKIWIPSYSSTWIAPPIGEELDFSFVNSQKSFIFEEDGLKYYKTNKLFDMMQINNYSSKRIQTGNVLIFYDMNGNMKKVHVIHKQKNGDIIVQKEDLFAKENEWLKLRNCDFKLKLEVLLNKNIKDLSNNASIFTDNILSYYISKNLNIQSYNELSNLIVDEFKKNNINKTLRDLLQNFVNVMIYIDKDVLGNYTSRFVNQLKLKYYKLESIPFLNQTNILPEVYNSGDDEFITTFVERIERYKNYLIMKLARDIYVKLNPYDKSSYLPTPPVLEMSKLRDLDDICQNYENVSDIPKYKIVTYREGDKTYCFNILNIISRLRENINSNPVTEEEFTDEFIDYINMFDGLAFQEKEEEIEKVVQEEFVSDPFLEALYSEISKLEEKMLFGEDTESQQEIQEEIPLNKSYKPSFIKPIPILLYESEKQENPKEDESEQQENTKEDESEDSSEEYTAEVIIDYSSPDSDFEEDSESNSNEFSMKSPTKKCINCKKEVNSQLKTIIKDKGTKIVEFCDINCFEDWNEPDVN